MSHKRQVEGKKGFTIVSGNRRVKPGNTGTCDIYVVGGEIVNIDGENGCVVRTVIVLEDFCWFGGAVMRHPSSMCE